MIRQEYYSIKRNIESNMRIDSASLAVNCTGLEYIYPPYKLKKIRHDFYLMCFLSGSMPVVINQQEQTLSPETYIIIEPETFYSHQFDTGNVSYYWIHFSGNKARETIESLNIPLNTVIKTKITDEIQNCFQNLFKEFLIKDDKFSTVTNALLVEVLTYLSRRQDVKSKYLINSIEYIYKNYNKDISLQTLADLENLSLSRYRTVFRKHMKMSPLDFIIMQRMDTACHYLNQPSMSIEEVAQTVGYQNQFYFSRLFKKKLGISPKQYQKLQKQQ